FLSIRLSSGEKSDFPGLVASSMSLRSARTMFGLQPNSMRRARMNQLSPPSCTGGTGTGKLRDSDEALPTGLELGGSLSAMAVRHRQGRARDTDRACPNAS